MLNAVKKLHSLVAKNKKCVLTCIFTHPEPIAELGFVEFLPSTRRVRLYAAGYRHNKRLRAKDETVCRNPITLLSTKRSLERFPPISL